MSLNLQNDRILMKELNDKNLISELCNQLNIDFFDILGFNPEFKFHGSFVNERFIVYADNRFNSKFKYSIEFMFSIHYLKQLDVLKKDELYSKLTDQELCEIADERRTLTSIFIQYVGVSPPGHGVGTLLINSFLNRVKYICMFKKIYLTPQGIRAENFWRSVGFQDMVISDLKNKIYLGSFSAEMVYDLDIITK